MIDTHLPGSTSSFMPGAALLGRRTGSALSGSVVALFLLYGAACTRPGTDSCRRDADSRRSICASDGGGASDASRPHAGDASLDAAGGGFDATLDASSQGPGDSSLVDASSQGAEDGSPEDAGPIPTPGRLPLQGDLGVHDPAIIKAKGKYVIFSTGPGIQVKRSSDLLRWTNEGQVFATNPAWIAREVPGATDLWAPEIAVFGGRYHLYYSASTFGSNTSCIGHAIATDLTTLDFVDQGSVVCSRQSDNYNAIDPAFVVDSSGTAWLAFGSFWSGIKLIRLDADGKRDGTELYSLASRDAAGAIEAPYVIKRGAYYYLFVSFDLCCRGTSSTYRIMVGRSKTLQGPFHDASGNDMLHAGGGTEVVIGNQRWRGPGHNTVLTDGATQYLVYHSYDADNNGAPTLRIVELLWDNDGWPVPAGP